MELLQIILFSLIGITTGFISGMFGIGGGSVRIPFLAMTGMPLINAFATNMLAIPFSSAIGAYTQRKNINWKIAKSFTIGGIIGIIIATALTGLFSSKSLAIIFLLATIITVIGLYLKEISKKIYEKLKPTDFNLAFGAFAGNLIIGLRGGSGGTLFPPILTAMHIEIHEAIATSLFAGIFSSLAALSIYFLRNEIFIIPSLIIAVTGMIGSYAGSKVSLKAKSKYLKLGLSLIVIILACYVAYNEFL